MLGNAKVASGSIVLLSDGADLGSLDSLDKVVAAAKERRVRIFTVGLRSGAYDPQPLRTIADRTGGSYAEARSAAELASIYERLGEQLAGEYLVRYRSAARPMSQVDVSVAIDGSGTARTEYVAPTPSLLAPYHRSPVASFLLSPGSPVVISLFFGLLVCALLLMLVRRPKTTVVYRVQKFVRERPAASQHAASIALQTATRNRYTTGWWAELERDLELARMSVTARQVAGLALGGTFLIGLVALMFSAPLLALFGLTTPFIARAVVRRKLKAVRQEFAEQFPGSLQVLASALRAGHSFNGALGVVVDNVHEPARSELARVVQDDRLGVMPEDAMRKLADRMANRDIEQVALLAELQRTSGGNSAEILDTVVAHDPRAGGDAPTRQDADRAGSDGAVDPDCSSDLPGLVSLARPPRSDGELLLERDRSGLTRRRRGDGRDGVSHHPAHHRHRSLGATKCSSCSCSVSRSSPLRRFS